MALVLHMLVILCFPLASPQSGGGDDDDFAEGSSANCYFEFRIRHSKLTCSMVDEPTEDVEFMTICDPRRCMNGTRRKNAFTFHDLELLEEYNLTTHFKEKEDIHQAIELKKIIKLPTPKIEGIAYDKSDNIHINITYDHDFVKTPIFQVQIQGSKTMKIFEVEYKPIILSAESLKADKVHQVRVRAKPSAGYFSGRWTEWSPSKSLVLDRGEGNEEAASPAWQNVVLCILVFTGVVLLIGIGSMPLVRRGVKACVSPNIPGPKFTLAQIHKAKEGPPVSFSPEMFNDTHIHMVNYDNESKLPPESQEGLDSTSVTASLCSASHRDSQATTPCLELDVEDQLSKGEVSTLRVRLLDESSSLDRGIDNISAHGARAPKREYKDEDYVTMPSLYKIQ